MLFIKTTLDPERGARFIETEVTSGSHLNTALHEARILADRLECGVQFEGNGHLFYIRPGEDVDAQWAWFCQIYDLDL